MNRFNSLLNAHCDANYRIEILSFTLMNYLLQGHHGSFKLFVSYQLSQSVGRNDCDDDATLISNLNGNC
jgi:hypothetical protein